MMTIDQQFPRIESPDVTQQSARASWWSGLTAWVRACGDAYVASAIYADLSRLSDAELRRRGLTRETLVRDVFMLCGRRD